MPEDRQDFAGAIEPERLGLTEMDFKIGELRFLIPLIQEPEDLERVANFAREIARVPFCGEFGQLSESDKRDYLTRVSDSLKNTPEDEAVIAQLLELIGELGRVRARKLFANRKR